LPRVDLRQDIGRRTNGLALAIVYLSGVVRPMPITFKLNSARTLIVKLENARQGRAAAQQFLMSKRKGQATHALARHCFLTFVQI
jgi:hypothetical protein